MRFVSSPDTVSIDNSGRILSLERVGLQLLLRDVEKATIADELPSSAVLSPDGSKLASLERVAGKGRVAVVVRRTGGGEVGRVVLKLPTRKRGKRTVTVSPRGYRPTMSGDGRRAFVVAGTTVFVVALDKPRLEWTRKFSGYEVEQVGGNGTRAVLRKLRKKTRLGMLGALAPMSRSGVLVIADLEHKRTLRTLGTQKAPFRYHDIKLSHDGTRLFVAREDRIDAIDLETGAPRTLVHTGKSGPLGSWPGVQRLRVAPDDSRISYTHGDAYVLDVASGRADKLPKRWSPLAFSPDGRLLLCKNGRAAVVSGKRYDVPEGHRSDVTGLAFIDGGRLLASAGRSVRMWDPRTGAPLGASAAQAASYQSGLLLAASFDGKRLAIGKREVMIAQTARRKFTRIGADHKVSALAFARGGALLVATNKGYSVGGLRHKKRLWLDPGRTLFRLDEKGNTVASENPGDVIQMVLSPDSKRLAVSTARYDRARRHTRVELRDPATLGGSVVVPGLEDHEQELAFAGPGTLIGAAPRRGAVAWDVARRRRVSRFSLGGCCGAIAVSPDGKLLATAADRAVQLWEIEPRTLRGVFRGHAGQVTALAFSPDGRWLASGGRDTSVLIWDTRAAKVPPAPAPELSTPGGATSVAALAPGRPGKALAVVSNGTLKASDEKLPKLPAGLVAVARGHGSSCAITKKRGVVCWGLSGGGLLGVKDKRGSASRLKPPRAVPGVAGAVRVALGVLYACAVDDQGAATCWGTLGSVIDSQAPARIAAGGKVQDVAIGIAHACALRVDGHVVCWGDNDAGQVGIAARARVGAPMVVPGIADATAIAVGNRHSCALRRTGAVVCWGDNSGEQLGNGTGIDARAPEAVRGLPAARALSADDSATCAVGRDGRVLCWGRLAGYGSSEVRFLQPTALDSLGKADRVRVVGGQVCAERGTAVRCARFERR